jgi:hypothetical protein
MGISPTDWYWSGTPGVYGSARGALVSSPTADTAYQEWLTIVDGKPTRNPTVWPSDTTGAQTTAALDAVLIAVGLPPTGLTMANLQSTLVAAASATAAAVTAKIYTDPSHQAAGQNAGMIVAATGGAPTSSSPFFAAFNNYAAAWGLAPTAFASLIEVLMNQSMALSSALNALEAASTAATTAAQLATALSTFETAIGAVVTAINAAGTPFPMTAPPAITIKDVNA